MENWLGLCLALLSVTCSCKAGGICSVPDTNKAYVTSLAINMGRSVGPCVTPDPSVLLAMNLGQVKDLTAEDILIKLLTKDAGVRVSNNEVFTSGKVALYVLALRSSCVNPRTIYVKGNSIDLVLILENKTHEELEDFEKNPPLPNPSVKTSWYQVGLDVLGLCIMSSPYAADAATILAKHIPADASGSVDTAAIVAMGLVCVLEMENVPKGKTIALKKTLFDLIKYMLENQNDGLIGNAYSTGLAGQALIAAKEYCSLDSWDCPRTIEKVMELIQQNTFSLPISSAQLLPFLWGESYVSVKNITCSHDNVQVISVKFTVVNNLVGQYFINDITVQVTNGSTLLQVMEKAAEVDPAKFSFTIEDSSWGAFILSINHVEGSNNEKTYWQFLSENKSLMQGVSNYKPQNEENVIAIFSKY